MKRIELSSVGKDDDLGPGVTWDELLDGEIDRKLIEVLLPGSSPTEVQVQAIRDAKLLISRRNLVVSSSTNSGKTLIAYLALIRGVRQKKRVLLLEPLRALSQEKYDELSKVMELLEPVLGRRVGVAITTGDYRLNEETMQAPPPESGEIVVATPERIETILRNPDNDPWCESLSVVVVDEAQLLGDRLRGASLEYVLTSLKLLKAPPRFLLLSATLGDTELVERWLDPCDVVVCSRRNPPLHRTVAVLEEGEEANEVVTEHVREVLEISGSSVLVFVYQTASADALARTIDAALGGVGVRSYHSRQSAGTRDKVRQEFAGGDCRCVVTTTALGMGVNLPATHVVLRDLGRGPSGLVPAGELLQMAGRAGRGDRQGYALLVLKPSDRWREDELVDAMENERIEAISSVLVGTQSASQWGDGNKEEPALCEMVLSLLARKGAEGLSVGELEAYLGASLAGVEGVAGIPESLAWLSAPSRVLAHCEEEVWRCTALGDRVIRASMPLSAAVGIAQLMRDLLSVDDSDAVLREIGTLDLLFLAELLGTGTTLRLRFSEKLVDQVDAWFGASDEKSVLYRKWVRGGEGFCQADEILGSLGVTSGNAQQARKIAYLSLARAVILWQRANGVTAEDVARRWKVKDLPEVEERWRDNRLFILGAMTGIWDLRCFFYHLKEECCAGDERVLRVKRCLQRMRGVNLQLLNLVAWCSPLGSVFVRLRAAQGGGGAQLPARATMRKLEDGGVRTVADLRALDEGEWKKLGIRADLAGRIRAFLRR